jgi:hypothetical protein
MSASVNGTAWAANYPVTGVYTGGVFDLGGIQVKSGDSTVFAVSFGLPFTVNQAFSSDTTSLDIEYADSKNDQVYDGSFLTVSSHSLVTVTTYDSTGKKLSGTFSGVLYNVTGGTDSISVTGGTFSASYVTQ